MMKKFKSLSDFTAHVSRGSNALNLRRKEQIALNVGAKFLQHKAKAQFGHYPNEMTHLDLPFNAAPHSGIWDELAPSTKEDRVRKGFSENEPLLRTGKLRDSIKVSVQGNRAVVGSDEDIMVWQELGTEKIPPRPVLTLTADRHGKDAVKLIADAFVSELMGVSRFADATTIDEKDIIRGND